MDNPVTVTINDKREGIRVMLASMNLTNKDAGELFGTNASAIGYMTDTKKVAPLYEKVRQHFEEFKKSQE